jgi:hypothetical protein
LAENNKIITHSNKQARQPFKKAYTYVGEWRRAILAMVPPSVRIKREAPPAPRPSRAAFTAAAAVDGFGLAPSLPPPASRVGVGASTTDTKSHKEAMYNNFLKEMAELGALA